MHGLCARRQAGKTYIVAVRVLNKRERVVRDLVHKLNTLVLRSVVDAALKHAATVAVSGYLDAVGSDGVIDELVILGRELVQALLDNVVTVEVLDENNNVQAESDDDGVDLAARREEVDHLLDGARAVHVEGDVDEVLGDGLADEVTLLVGAELEELLTQVVAEGIYEKLY